MKDSVDLTLDRVFSRRPHINRITKTGNGKYHWDHSNKYDCYTYNSPILLGSKEEREFQRECRISNDTNYCDCCGTRLNRIPWKREVGVCNKCQDNYEKDDLNKKQKCPWRKPKYVSILLNTFNNIQEFTIVQSEQDL